MQDLWARGLTCSGVLRTVRPRRKATQNESHAHTHTHGKSHKRKRSDSEDENSAEAGEGGEEGGDVEAGDTPWCACVVDQSKVPR